jgi:hypothetical protein
MQLFATLLIAASLAASVLAASISRISARTTASDFFAGTQTGDGQSPFSPLSGDDLIPMSRALH